MPVQEGELLLSLVGNPIEMHAVIADEGQSGEFVWFDYTMRKWTVVDADYNVLDTLTQSFEADDDYHDVQLLADNSYLVVLLEEVFMDLTDIGGILTACWCFGSGEHMPLDPN